MDEAPAPIGPWLRRLRESRPADAPGGLAADALSRLDATQVIDALWLAAHWPLGAGPAAPAQTTNAAPAATPPAIASTARTAAAKPPAAPGAMVEVSIGPGDAQAAAPAAQGIYPNVQDDASGGSLRASPIRVAGVPALRDAPAMARALRPLGRKRRSSTRYQLDEEATLERFADTRVLVPVFTPERERYFAATLLIEESAALPLWRTLAGELDTLLARQGGFRSLRRYRLALVDGALKLRSRSGALHSPRLLLDDDSSLVLLATDGSSPAWADGRMTGLLQALGGRTSLALLQWMPRRLWPHTALGDAEGWVSAPRPGAANAELRLRRPDWLSPDEPVLAVPMAALTPGSLAQLAAMLMAKPGQPGPAALLWPASADPTPGQPSSAPPAPEPAKPPPTASELDAQAAARISAFRSVASARALQAAVQLSAAAPLTLPVIRLVHRVMQPNAPAEDLPLLLLGGLLTLDKSDAQRQGRLPMDDENAVRFDFAPGVRQRLQASLLKHEAAEVFQAVSRHITERSGSAHDFNALLLDPEGPLPLPDWAQPFAEVTRQVRALFTTPQQGTAPRRLQEAAWAPGVTLQAATELPAPARQLAWQPDSQRLAVLHEYGLQMLALQQAPSDGRLTLQALPLAMRGATHLLFIKGFAMHEAAIEALIAQVREGWAAHFGGELKLHFHTVNEQGARNDRHRDVVEREVDALMRLSGKERALWCLVGGPAFMTSAWLRQVRDLLMKRLDLSLPPPVLMITGDGLVNSPGQDQRWQITRLPNDQQVAQVRGDAAQVGQALLAMLRQLGASALPMVAFSATLQSVAWGANSDLHAFGTRRQHSVYQTQVVDQSPMGGTLSAAPLEAMAALVDEGVFVYGVGPELCMSTPSKPTGPPQFQARANIAGLAWSSDGAQLALRDANGVLQLLERRPEGLRIQSPDSAGRIVRPGLAWAHGRAALAVAAASRPDGMELWCIEDGQDRALAALPATPEALAWSSDDSLIACALPGGRIVVVRHRPDGEASWTRSFALPEPIEGAVTLLAFAPRRIDAAHETLAVAHGERLHLLRLNPASLAPAPVQAAPIIAQAEAAMPQAAPGLDAPQVLDLALRFLAKMAAAFARCALLPDGPGKASERYTRALQLEEGSPDWCSLRQLLSFAQDDALDSVRQALQTGHDTVAHPDTERAHRMLPRLMSAAQERAQDFHSSLLAGIADQPIEQLGSKARDVDADVRWLNRLAADLSAEEAEAIGWRGSGLLDQLRRLSSAAFTPALANLPTSRVLPEHLPIEARRWLECLTATLSQTDWLSGMAVHWSRHNQLGLDRGPSIFSGCRRFDDLFGRVIEAWMGFGRQLSERLDRDTGASVHVRIALAPEERAWITSTTQAFGLDLQAQVSDAMSTETSERTIQWRMTRAEFAAVLRQLGAIVHTQLALRLNGPLPAHWGVPGSRVLWVDDRPDNTSRERQELAGLGFNLITAVDTEQALAMLHANPFDALITDMGRPPDVQAGYTLLRAMQAQGLSLPVFIYAADQLPEHDAQARERGAVLSTDRLSVLAEGLKRALLSPQNTAA